MFDLSGRIALVTGAGRGIGAGIATTLARQGAAVAVNDLDEDAARSTAKSIVAAGGRAEAVPFDVTELDACRSGARAAEAALGPVDVLVNNAGGTPGGMWPTPFLETPHDAWAKLLDMNLIGTLNCASALVGGMVERGFGRVIGISSDAARVGHRGSSVYGAAKAGIEGFLRTLAREVGPKGVTANALVLGLIDTVPKEFLEQANVEKAYPMRRVGTPADVAAGVVYLASDEAGWVTGHSLVINGGGTG